MTTKEITKRVLPQMARVAWLDCPRPIPAYQTELPWVESDEEIIDAIGARILEAQDLDELLTLAEPTPFEQLIGRRIEISGFVMRASDLDEGPGGYAMIAYVDSDSGAGGFASTSAAGVVAQLARAFKQGWFPFGATVVEVETGKKGRSNPLYLTKIGTVLDRPGRPAPGGEEPF